MVHLRECLELLAILEAVQNFLLGFRTQFVPCITEDSTVQVTQFCRTPSWVVPSVRGDILTWCIISEILIVVICTDPEKLFPIST
jgi:hypothetical protein